MACYGAAGSSWVRGGASTTAWQGPWRLFPQRSRRDAADEEAAGQRGLSRSSGGRGAADAEGVWAARGLTVLCPQSAHMAMVDALMMAYTVEMISIEKVVASVERFSTFSASKELPYDLEDAMVFWVNKVRPGRLRARGGRGAGAGPGRCSPARGLCVLVPRAPRQVWFPEAFCCYEVPSTSGSFQCSPAPSAWRPFSGAGGQWGPWPQPPVVRKLLVCQRSPVRGSARPRRWTRAASRRVCERQTPARFQEAG